MPSQLTIPQPSSSGIIEDPTGSRHIPSSTRLDGSQRREIKIRPGYRPPEDVEVYKNLTADAWKNRGSGGIPGAEGLKEKEAEGEKGKGKGKGKNAKRREARKRAKGYGEEGEVNGVGVGEEDKVRNEGDIAKGNKREDEEQIDPDVEREKKARNLKKKLKQAKELKEKKEGGAALLPEQFAKVIKIQELIRELDALGFDAEGEPKVEEEVPR